MRVVGLNTQHSKVRSKQNVQSQKEVSESGTFRDVFRDVFQHFSELLGVRGKCSFSDTASLSDSFSSRNGRVCLGKCTFPILRELRGTFPIPTRFRMFSENVPFSKRSWKMYLFQYLELMICFSTLFKILGGRLFFHCLELKWSLQKMGYSSESTLFRGSGVLFRVVGVLFRGWGTLPGFCSGNHSCAGPFETARTSNRRSGVYVFVEILQF
jgi:hypothetical protein